MKEYKIAKGWAIFICITAPLLSLLFVFLLIMPLIPGMEEDFPASYYWSFSIISAGMIFITVAGIVDAIKGKFVIDKNKIFIVSIFSNRQLLFHEIKGYRITDKFIFIEPIKEDKKKIKISSYFAKTNEIKFWLTEHYPDLDMLQIATEKKEILSNAEFGWTKEQREEKLLQAQKVAKGLNSLGILIGLWALFFAKPYEYAIIASISFPIICILVFKYFNGLIKIDERKDSAYPSIFWSIFLPSMGLFLRTLLDFNIFDYAKVWPLTILITAICMGIILYRDQEFKGGMRYLSLFGIFLFIAAYSYGTVVSLNCTFDTSEPEIFNAKIVNKRMNSGKTKTYYLELTPWGSRKEAEEVTVSKQLYDSLYTNDPVSIYFMKGKLDIPWFEITKE